MAFASSSTRTLRSRSLPLLTATALSISCYTIYTHSKPLLSDDSTAPATVPQAILTPAKKSGKFAVDTSLAPFTPLGWGSNRYLTLLPDQTVSNLKKPTPLGQFASTPLRDVVVAEKYGACIDAKGDCWMWGMGYDPSGMVGRSLKGKVG
jgi:hypothetical protein